MNKRLQNRIMVSNGDNAGAFEPNYRPRRGGYDGRIRRDLSDEFYACFWYPTCDTCELSDCISEEFDYYTIVCEVERRGITFEEARDRLLAYKLANLVKV